MKALAFAIVPFLCFYSSFAQTKEAIEPILEEYQVPQLSEKEAYRFDYRNTSNFIDLRSGWLISHKQTDESMTFNGTRLKNVKTTHYTKSFLSPPNINNFGGVFLHLEQLDNSFDIYLNGHKLENSHALHYLTYNVTKILIDSLNTLQIQTKNENTPPLIQDLFVFGVPRFYFYSFSTGLMDTSNNDYFTCRSGINKLDIYNEVSYETSVKVFHKNFTYSPELIQSAFGIKAYFNNDATQSYYKAYSHTTGTRGNIFKNSRIDGGCSRSPRVGASWNAESPKLYKVIHKAQTNLSSDSMFSYQYIGFKTMVTNTSESIVFNNKPTTLKAIAISRVYGKEEDIRQKLFWLKQNHFNTLLLSEYAPQLCYQLCDTLGIYVINSIDSNQVEKAKQLYIYQRKNSCVIGSLYLKPLTKVQLLSLKRANGFQAGMEDIPLKLLLQSSKSSSIADITFSFEDIGDMSNARLMNLKSHYNPINVFHSDSLQNIIGLQNNFDFLEVGKDVIAKWELLENNNIIQSKVLSKINIEPHQCKEIEVNIKSFPKKSNTLYVLRVVSYFSEKPFWAKNKLIYSEDFELNMDFWPLIKLK